MNLHLHFGIRPSRYLYHHIQNSHPIIHSKRNVMKWWYVLVTTLCNIRYKIRLIHPLPNKQHVSHVHVAHWCTCGSQLSTRFRAPPHCRPPCVCIRRVFVESGEEDWHVWRRYQRTRGSERGLSVITSGEKAWLHPVPHHVFNMLKFDHRHGGSACN